MASEHMDYTAMLADLEAKRAALDQMIASLRTALALGALGQAGDVPPPSNGIVPSTFVPSMTGGDVPAGAFLGKSIPEAAKLYLEIVKKKQTSKEITEALLKGGMESTSKNFPQIVHSVLDRARKANTGIVKLDRSYWGLAEWYPASLLSSIAQEKRVPRKKARKAKAKLNTPAGQATAPSQPALPPAAPQKAGDRVLELLLRNPEGEYSAHGIGARLEMNETGVRLILGKLVKAGKIRMTAPGMYTAGALQLSAAS